MTTTPTTIGFEFGEIVLVRFPFTNQRTTKQRPAAVISSHAYHGARNDLIIMAITSRSLVHEGFGESAIGDWRAAGLLKPSLFKPLIATLEVGVIRRKLGRLRPDDLMSLRRIISEIIG
jgi:mRNA interferase MazF